MIEAIIIGSMRVLIALLTLGSTIAAQDRDGPRLCLNLKTTIGSEHSAQIHLAPPGCWDGLLMSVTSYTALSTPPSSTISSHPPRMAEATVEVWGIAFQESRTQETFRLFREELILSIKENWRFEPPSHGVIDAAIRSGGNGAGTDMVMVQSLQQRFNRPPPNGSPAK